MKFRLKIIYLLFTLCLITFLYIGINKVKKDNEEINFKALKDAIQKATVQCYALEGFYPPNIKYLEENYGIIVDSEKYIISYIVFASNIMPEIEIFQRQH